MKFHDDLKKIADRAERAISEAKDATAAEAVWREYAGKHGIFRERLRTIGKLSQRERAQAGKAVHAALIKFEAAAEDRLSRLRVQWSARLEEHERIDVTLPGAARMRGTLHPLTLVRRKAESIFLSLGFSIAEGPEVETSWYNFDALNIPENHPARDLWDTFWLSGTNQNVAKSRELESELTRNAKDRLLLRTHTSPVQVRYMQTHQPPFRIIAPGQTFRYEATDASHDFQFSQIEGLMVDKRDALSPVTMATLLAVLKTFFERFFEKPIAFRVRPSYFPFVEPGIEVDLSCIVCAGKGCSVCKQTGWLEMLGAGMVHPNVFEAVGFNPKEVQGFAFGFGIDRLAMLKCRIPDVRLFRSGDLSFLKQFR